MDGKPCVLLRVEPDGKANARDLSRAVRERLEGLAKRFPEGVSYRALQPEP